MKHYHVFTNVCSPNSVRSCLVAKHFLFGQGLTRGLTLGKLVFSGCSSALGMASGEIKDYQLTASSTYSDSQPYQARPSKQIGNEDVTILIS